MELTRLGENICRLRTEKRMSQEELAAALAVSRQSVSKWETGASVPDLDKLLRLSEIFGVTLDALVNGPAQPEETGAGAGAAAGHAGPAVAAAQQPGAANAASRAEVPGKTASAVPPAAGDAGGQAAKSAAPQPSLADTAAVPCAAMPGKTVSAAQPAAGTPASQAAAPRAPARPLGQLIAGGVLLGFGALVWLLFTLLGGVLAGLIYASPFLICGIICLTARRHAGLWCAWTAVFLVDVYLRWATGLNWRMVRYTFLWEESWNYVRLAVAWGQAVALAALLLGTVWRLGRRPLALTRPHRLGLAAGWLGTAVLTLGMETVPFLLRDTGGLTAALWRFSYYVGDWLVLAAWAAVLTATVRALHAARARKN